jgi:hypothetical protein
VEWNHEPDQDRLVQELLVGEGRTMEVSRTDGRQIDVKKTENGEYWRGFRALEGRLAKKQEFRIQPQSRALSLSVVIFEFGITQLYS